MINEIGKIREIKNHKKRQVPENKDDEKSTGNTGSGKCLIISPYMQSELYTDFGISQANRTKTTGIYNQSN